MHCALGWHSSVQFKSPKNTRKLFVYSFNHLQKGGVSRVSRVLFKTISCAIFLQMQKSVNVLGSLSTILMDLLLWTADKMTCKVEDGNSCCLETNDKLNLHYNYYDVIHWLFEAGIRFADKMMEAWLTKMNTVILAAIEATLPCTPCFTISITSAHISSEVTNSIMTFPWRRTDMVGIGNNSIL